MKAIFNQFFGIGDILFIEPIMRRFFQQGYEVVLPVLEKYYDCRIVDWMKDNGFIHIFASGVDLNNSFMVVGELQKT